MFEIFVQVAIAVLSGVAMWLVGRIESWKRWGYIIGLCSQPFWFYSTIATEQWGIFVLAIWYTYCWIQGIYNYWVKKEV